MPDEKVSVLVAQDVNVHGELHLDAVKTKALIRWLTVVENAIELHENSATELSEIPFIADMMKKVAVQG